MAKLTHKARKEKMHRLQKWAAEKISQLTCLSWGKDCPIESRPSGENGPDVRLDSEARRLFPLTLECKNQETWDVPGAIRQAKANAYDGTDWLVVMKRSREAPVAILDAEVLFKILERLQRLKRTRTI